MNTNILITGGTGLVGKQLTEILQKSGYQVSHLSRNPIKSSVPSFYWNPSNGEIDLNCLINTKYIINLAGAGVADARWTDSYKEEILQSRLLSTQLISKILKENEHDVEAVINASAVGIYGNEVITPASETAPVADTFLANVCKQWEHEALLMNTEKTRVVLLRIGLVLSEKGGFLKAIAAPAKFGVGTYFGNGYMMNPWIHIDDLCKMFLFAIQNPQITGAYNAVAPNPETNKRLVELTAQTLSRPQFLPGVPVFVLKLIMGEMATMLLANQNISADKILSNGFNFQFEDAKSAIENLLK